MSTMDQPQPTPLPVQLPPPYPAEPLPELWRSEAFPEDLSED